MTKPWDALPRDANWDLVIPPVDYGIPYRIPRSQRDKRRAAWDKLSGNHYILARPQAWAFPAPEERLFFRLRVVKRYSTAQRLAVEDNAPVIFLGDKNELMSWQYDYDLYFGRTAGGRFALQVWGLELDKFRNPDHPAHKIRTE